VLNVLDAHHAHLAKTVVVVIATIQNNMTVENSKMINFTEELNIYGYSRYTSI